MNASHVIFAAPALSAGLALSFLGLNRRTLLKPIYLTWALFAAGIICFLLLQANAAGVPLGPVAIVVTMIGLPSCGLSWLLARALFKQDGASTLWPIGVVVALFLTGAVLNAARLAGIEAENALMSMTGTIHTLTSSTVLLLALIEPVEGFRRSLPRQEKVFRLSFILGYAMLVAVSVIWERHVLAQGEAALSFVRVTCAMLALAGATAAVMFRAANPLPVTARKAAKPAPRPVTSDEQVLAERISALMSRGDIHTRPEVKVGDLAAALGEPDYRVSRAITGVLGFANFNRLINSYRIEHAKRLLADRDCASWSILSIAMECGFGSIGSFNRAFKQAESMTPGAWRQAELGSDHLTGGISVARSASR